MPNPALDAVVLCPLASGPIELDGALDEASWSLAAELPMVLPVTHGAPAAASRVRLLWDAEGLYWAAELEDADLFADLSEHDSPTWNNDVLELFLKPAADRPGYYELHVTPLGTTMDVYLRDRVRGAWAQWVGADPFHLQVAVALRGTLQRGDVDQGWTVEAFVPWADLAPSGGAPLAGEVWTFSACRYDYVLTLAPELSCTAPLWAPDFHRTAEYQQLRFVGQGAQSR